MADGLYAVMRKAHELEKGVLYPTLKFEVKEPTTECNYRSIKVTICDEGLNFFVYLPKKHSNMSLQKVEDYNKDIASGKPSSICFYGKMGRMNVVEIHNFGEGVNEGLLAKVTKLETLMGAEYTPGKAVKRSSDGSSSNDEQSPSKAGKSNLK